MNAEGLIVDVIADVVCPWSFMGKRSLDRALERVEGPVAVRWHPFQLNPDVPRGGVSFRSYLERRFGSMEQVRPALGELAALGLKAGIRFDFERMARVPNTLDAHRVLAYASERGRQHQLADRLLSGFFEEGLDVGDRAVLLDLAAETGLPPTEVAGVLDDPATLKLVNAAEAEVRRAGFTSSPNYLINQRLLVPGAQDSAVLLTAFDQALFPAPKDAPATLH
jgi:predicted DsbA family dithiol-disulfide isomerase